MGYGLTSHQFFCGTVPTGFVDFATVPDGERWLIRDVRLRIPDIAFYVQLQLEGPDGFGVVSEIIPNVELGHTETDCFVIAEAGDKLWWFAEDPDVQAIVSGNILTIM